MKLAETPEHKQIIQLLKDIQCNYKAIGEYLLLKKKLNYCPYPEVEGKNFGRLVIESFIDDLETRGKNIVIEKR